MRASDNLPNGCGSHTARVWHCAHRLRGALAHGYRAPRSRRALAHETPRTGLRQVPGRPVRSHHMGRCPIDDLDSRSASSSIIVQNAHSPARHLPRPVGALVVCGGFLGSEGALYGFRRFVSTASGPLEDRWAMAACESIVESRRAHRRQRERHRESTSARMGPQRVPGRTMRVLDDYRRRWWSRAEVVNRAPAHMV